MKKMKSRISRRELSGHAVDGVEEEEGRDDQGASHRRRRVATGCFTPEKSSVSFRPWRWGVVGDLPGGGGKERVNGQRRC